MCLVAARFFSQRSHSHPKHVFEQMCLPATCKGRQNYHSRIHVFIRNSFFRNGVIPTLSTSSNKCVYSQLVFATESFPPQASSLNSNILFCRNGVTPSLRHEEKRKQNETKQKRVSASQKKNVSNNGIEQTSETNNKQKQKHERSNNKTVSNHRIKRNAKHA